MSVYACVVQIVYWDIVIYIQDETYITSVLVAGYEIYKDTIVLVEIILKHNFVAKNIWVCIFLRKYVTHILFATAEHGFS